MLQESASGARVLHTEHLAAQATRHQRMVVIHNMPVNKQGGQAPRPAKTPHVGQETTRKKIVYNRQQGGLEKTSDALLPRMRRSHVPHVHCCWCAHAGILSCPGSSTQEGCKCVPNISSHMVHWGQHTAVIHCCPTQHCYCTTLLHQQLGFPLTINPACKSMVTTTQVDVYRTSPHKVGVSGSNSSNNTTG